MNRSLEKCKPTIAARERLAGRPNRARWLACAAALCLCLGFGAACAPAEGETAAPPQATAPPAAAEPPAAAAPQRVASLLLSINPSIEFTVDESGALLGVAGKNEDGVALIAGVDFLGLSFENAAVVVVNKLIEQNYITVLEIDRTISLSLAGDECRIALMERMSEAIRAAATPYDIALDTRETGEDSLEIVLAAQEPVPGALPPADPKALPTYLQIEYVLTGHINAPEDIGWAEVDGVRIFRAGRTEVADVYLTIDGAARYRASEIVEFDTASDWLSTSTLQCLHALITKGYIADDMPGKAVITFEKSTAEQRQDVAALADLILREAGLSLRAQAEGKQIEIVPSEPNTEPAGKYAMAELLDTHINKERADITALQMEILQRAYTPEGAEERLKTRRFAVIPELVGLREEEAVALARVRI